MDTRFHRSRNADWTQHCVVILGGSVLAWAIIGPALIHQKMAFGTAIVPDDPKWGDYMSFGSLGLAASNKETPSPRFWMLWPGVLLMIVVSFTELFLQYKVGGH